MSKLRNSRGDASFLSVIFITAISMMTVAVMLSLLSVISVKNSLDSAADQVARQIQISGKVSSETTELITYLRDGIKADSVDFQIQTEYCSVVGDESYIQLGTPFYLTVTAETSLGGVFSCVPFSLTLCTRCAGVSEVYHK